MFKINPNNIKNYAPKIALAVIASSMILSSCTKDNSLPKNEQFQKVVGDYKVLGHIEGNYKDPSLSVMDFDKNGKLDFGISNQTDHKVYFFEQKEDGSISEESDKTFGPAGHFLLTEFTGKVIGNKLYSFVGGQKNDYYPSEYAFETSSIYINNESKYLPRETNGNDGMLGSYDLDGNGALDVFVAKLDNDQKLRNVYVYNGNVLPSGEPSGVYTYNDLPYVRLPENTISFDFADADADGSLDLIVLNNNKDIIAYKLFDRE